MSYRIILVVLAALFVAVPSISSKSRNNQGDVATKSSVKNSPETQSFTNGTTYTACFVPGQDGQDCESVVVEEINRAKQSILVQAYYFTSAPIAKALSEAKQRGVDVRVIVDKSQKTQRYSGATFLVHAGIPVVVDEQPSIAHNKIMIFDQVAVLTGSFNFTKSAQQNNAENLLVIRGDANLVRLYTQNWQARARVSVAF